MGWWFFYLATSAALAESNENRKRRCVMPKIEGIHTGMLSAIQENWHEGSLIPGAERWKMYRVQRTDIITFDAHRIITSYITEIGVVVVAFFHTLHLIWYSKSFNH